MVLNAAAKQEDEEVFKLLFKVIKLRLSGSLTIKYIKGPMQAPSYLVTAELRTCRYM